MLHLATVKKVIGWESLSKECINSSGGGGSSDGTSDGGGVGKMGLFCLCSK